MESFDKIHQLALDYFEGIIGGDDEAALFAFVTESNEHKALLDQWEREWAAGHVVDTATQQAWQRQLERMQQMRQPMRGRARRRLAAVAASVVLVVGLAAWGLVALWQKPVQQFAYKVPYGSKSQVLLPDSSAVWLNAGSTLRYTSLYNQKNRCVQLEGEGYFEVARQDGREFVVQTKGCDVVVKGTHFDVSAYNDDKLTTVSLMEGHVTVNRDLQQVDMQPGEMVVLDRATGQVRKSTFNNDRRAWIDNCTDLDEITLAEMAKQLSRQYDVNIRVTSPTLAHMKFSVSLRNKETVSEVLQALQLTQKMKVVRNGRNISISE